ncbi:MAG TPA: helix-turn-helix transcriptional regulator, partial [Acidimicrobiales bacterium]|nr:helix-turn-helix transcriptional regulator [Acidimicrobiales bacterium]
QRPQEGWEALTASEQRVVALVAEGLTNAQIAKALFVSRHTVESHVSHVFTKLGVASRTELAARAVARGLRRP